MLEWYSDTVAVEKMLGEVYDKITILNYEKYQPKWKEKKYLSDSNGWDSANTVSKEESLWTYRGKDMRFDTEEWRQTIRDCISNQEATIQHLQKNSFI